jgi:hypothetical protein
MGRLVEALASEYGFSVAGTVDVDNAADPEAWPAAPAPAPAIRLRR